MRGGGRAAAAAIGLLLLTAGFAFAEERTRLPLRSVEIADEPAERSRGMMGRRELCDTCGMLFIWPDEQVRSFWMKNTPLPLDMIFLNSRGEVVSVIADTEPFRERPPYVARRPARFVLETKAGYAAAHGVREGALVDLEALFAVAEPYRWPSD